MVVKRDAVMRERGCMCGGMVPGRCLLVPRFAVLMWWVRRVKGAIYKARIGRGITGSLDVVVRQCRKLRMTEGGFTQPIEMPRACGGVGAGAGLRGCGDRLLV